MKELLKEVLTEQHAYTDESYIKRSFPDTLIQCQEIIVISGIRRCGKSTLLRQLRNDNNESDYYINFDDERLLQFKADDFRVLHELFIEMFGEQHTFYFDEIQNIPEWERFVRRLFDSGNKVFLTGSNATMLSRELGTRLTGRHLSYELFPFSFREYLSFSGHEFHYDDVYKTKARATLSKYFEEYLYNGGFPQYLKNKNPDYLRSLFENILYRDVMVRNKLTNERELLELVYFLASNAAKLSSYNSLTGATGIKSPTTVKNYIEYISNTYMLYQLNRFDYSVKKQIQNPKKTYFVDNALASKLGFSFSSNKGRFLENLVFVELRRRKAEMYYHSGKHECDFLIRDGANIINAVQVCHNFNHAETQAREIKGVQEAMDMYNLSSGLILTHDHEESLQLKGKTVEVKMVWKWLLEEG
ncbi:MAG: ATP-binding protein [Bacteroidales bacterium]|nr:ATP-binding protein [Bacteroidales bacterium]